MNPAEAPVVNDKFAAPTVPSNAWVSSPRSYLYAVVFFLVGALSAHFFDGETWDSS